jgi:Protein of unknown function (DUF3109)
MFPLGKTIVSEDIIEKDFACNLTACKGACCVYGYAGAPLEDEETAILNDIYPKVKPFLSQEGIQAIEAQGTVVKGEDGDWETPLVNGGECAYVFFDNSNIAKCGIEEAYHKGIINWKKPVSCHLYPVRVHQFSTFTAVNYHKWQICDEARASGKKLQIPVYKFVKEALIRKFGEDWYLELEQIAEKLKR